MYYNNLGLPNSIIFTLKALSASLLVHLKRPSYSQIKKNGRPREFNDVSYGRCLVQNSRAVGCIESETLGPTKQPLE
jgi:hypothetical protein